MHAWFGRSVLWTKINVSSTYSWLHIIHWDFSLWLDLGFMYWKSASKATRLRAWKRGNAASGQSRAIIMAYRSTAVLHRTNTGLATSTDNVIKWYRRLENIIITIIIICVKVHNFYLSIGSDLRWSFSTVLGQIPDSHPLLVAPNPSSLHISTFSFVLLLFPHYFHFFYVSIYPVSFSNHISLPPVRWTAIENLVLNLFTLRCNSYSSHIHAISSFAQCITTEKKSKSPRRLINLRRVELA